ncbi:MAG TPA: efflux RND transporter periplasmic adaptor subunit [Pirellula sp.]|nr:efflux RND transporter periplasmic adaptor subunit [Pirellula sp.]
MNIRDVVPTTPNTQDCRTVPPSVASGRGDTIHNMLEVVETVHQLCSDATENAESFNRLESNATVTKITGAEKVDASVQETFIPAFDVLSNYFLQSVVNHVAGLNGLSIGLLVTSKSGIVVQSVQSGWDNSNFRIQSRVLAQIAKECVWRMEPLFSTDALMGCLDENEVDANTEKVEASVLLNELSSIIGTPLFAVAFPLKESSGFAIFLCEATPCIKNGIVKYFSGASQIWLGKLSLESLIRQLDTWLIVKRCSWFARIVSLAESIRSNPRWWVIPIVLLCVAMLAPVPYYLRRDCVFEPETKQYLSSPILGRIASCEVRPGDRVEKGQIMARMDDDQLRRDLATAQAEYDGALKRRDSALATRAIGNAGLAKIEMEQATRRIESIQDQLSRLEIRATATGVVVQGDWQRNVGMPLTLGQSLFEVAELESMTAELRLRSSDLAEIHVGDEVSVRSDASGISTFRGKISRIEPRATVIDEAAVFVADVVIHDPDRQLRPGMKASAQINAGWRTLGWYLFNRPFRWIANQWIW